MFQLSEIKASFLGKWNNLQPRERALIILGLALLLLITLYRFAWHYPANMVKSAQSNLEQSVEEYEWLKSIAPSVKVNTSLSSRDEMVGFITSSLSQAGIGSNHNLDSDSEIITVKIPSTKDAKVFRWLKALEQKGVYPSSVNMLNLSNGEVSTTVRFVGN